MGNPFAGMTLDILNDRIFRFTTDLNFEEWN
jgi:hypothetical protein